MINPPEYNYFDPVTVTSPKYCGLCKRHSAQHCLMVLLKKFKESRDQEDEFGALFTGLSKAFDCIRDLKVDECQSNLYVMPKQSLFPYKLYYFFSLMNRTCYNNLFQFMQHDNFRNLNRMIFTH